MPKIYFEFIEKVYLPTGKAGIPSGEKAEKIKLGVGYDSTRTFLKEKENKKIAEQILKEIRKKFTEQS